MAGKHFEEFEPERLVKSIERVRDLGEVFTPANIVDEMLDMLPNEMWSVYPAKTYLEPSVGNGNFVSAILSRKLTLVDEVFRSQLLPAGNDLSAVEYHGLEALSSIYGIDISEDNIVGGTYGHEIACRPRLLKIMERWHASISNRNPEPDSPFMQSAAWILEHNMIIGNMLARDADGKPSGRDELPLMEYVWTPETKSVELLRTTLGAVIGEAEESDTDVLSFFGPAPAARIWRGPAIEMHEAERHSTVVLNGRKITNSRGRSK